MDSRRKFIGTMATGLATTLASQNVLGATERVRLGIIGTGARGVELTRWATACPDVQVAAFADVYTKSLESAQRLIPDAQLYRDYGNLLDDKTIDAVVIATPPHLHAAQFIDSLSAGKHVYQERTLAFNVDHAKRMRAAYRQTGRRTVQVGHQACSSGHLKDAGDFLAGGKIGKITAIHMRSFRNTPHGKPHWARPVYASMSSGEVGWDSFLGEAPHRDFDPNRFVNWRLFADYSGGSVHENMSQQLAFWYRALGLQIPDAVNMSGGTYLWKDGREIPDTMNVTLEQPEQMLVTWDSGFGNNQLGTAEDVLGTDGTILRGQAIRYLPQKINQPDGSEMLGRSATAPAAHMQNFIDCIRSGREPNCPFDLGYRVSIACAMALESYRLGRSVRWDRVRETIV